MKKLVFFIFCLIFSSSVVLGAGASKAKTKSMAFTNDIIQSNNAFTFHFTNSTIGDDVLGTFTHEPIMNCYDYQNKLVNASFEYAGLDLIVVHLSEQIKEGTTYECRLNPKFTNSSDAIRFSTLPFKIKSMTMLSDDLLKISFNDFVNDDELKNNLKLYKLDKLAKSNLSYKIEKSDGKNFIIKINEKYYSLKATISAKLKSKYDISLKRNFEKTFDTDGYSYQENTEIKSLVVYDEPKFLSLDKGQIKLRVFLPAFATSKSYNKYIKIDKIEQFDVSDFFYVDYDMDYKLAQELKLDKNSWAFFDIIADFKPHQSYKITLKKGLGDNYSELKEDKTYTIKTGDRGVYLEFESDKPYISSLGEIGIKSVNVSEINVVVDKLLNHNFRYFINFNQDQNVDMMTKQVSSKKFDIGGKKNEFLNNKFSLKDMFKNEKSGIYKINIYYDNDKKTSKKVYLSDIGISAKLYKNGLFVQALNLSDTQAVKNAKVSVYSTSNDLITSKMTDAYGSVLIDEKDFISKNPKSIVVEKDSDKNFLILNETIDKKYIKDYNKKDFNTFVYFQSQLIRPDEKLNSLIILKDNNYKSIQNAPVLISIKDPLGKSVYKKPHKTNEKGVISLEIPLLGQKTGKYDYEVFHANKIIASKEFLIEAFLPQQLKNTIKTDKEQYFASSSFDLNLSSKYLFGAPASGLKGNIRLRGIDKEYKNDKFKDYSFINSIKLSKNYQSYIGISKNLVLNKDGKAYLSLSTNINEEPSSVVEGQLEFTVFDDGQSVSAYKNIIILPYKKMVGVKLSSKVIDQSTPLKIDTILINPLSNETEKGELNAFVKRVKWYYTYDSNGFFKWNKDIETIGHFKLNSSESFSKTFPRSGDYILEVQYESGHSATAEFVVSGWDYDSISPTNDLSKNEVNFEDKLYKKGDTLKLDIKSPIKVGKLLVTLEQERVLYSKLLDLKNAHATLEIPLDFDLKQGVYVSTMVVRATDSSSNLVPFRASSSSLVKADRLQHKLNPTISSSDITKSNSKFPLTIKANENSQILVSLVDDGILQILGQKPPKPYEFFTKDAQKLIENYDLYEELMHHLTKGGLLKFGSGATSMLAKKHLSPETNAKRVKPFVYFSKLIDIKSDKEAKLEIDIPGSFNGSATIIAFEISDDGIGSSSKSLIVKDDIILKPIYPRFGAINDEWKIPLRVFNTTDKEQKVSLSSNSKLMEISNLDQSISIEPNKSKLITFNAKVKDFGKGEIEIIAKTNNDKFVNKVELPLIYAYPLETYNVQGDTNIKKVIDVPQSYREHKSPKFNLSVSGDVLSRLKNGHKYLIDYPYGCSEQTSSRLLALLNVEPFLKFSQEDEAKALEYDRKNFINEAVIKLSNMQNHNGFFGYWDANGRVNTYASIYASDVLLELKNSGFDLPLDTQTNIYKSLELVSKNSSNKYTNFEQLYASYVLSRKNKLDIETINFIYDSAHYKGNLLELYMMAAILKNAKMDVEKNLVLSKINKFDISKMSNKRLYDESFYSKQRDLAFSLYIHLENFPKDKMSEKLLENVKKGFSELYSTQDRALSLRAIRAYYKDYDAKKLKFSIITNQKETYDKDIFMNSTLVNNQITIIPQDNWVNYNFSVYQYVPKPIKTAKGKKDLNIKRVFVDERGKIFDINKSKVGDFIYSKVNLTAKNKYKNVTINEQIPSCFEIVNERIAAPKRLKEVQNINFKPDYQDIRDDRMLSFTSIKSDENITFYTPLRITTSGICNLPPILTEVMYDERINDYDLHLQKFYVKE